MSGDGRQVRLRRGPRIGAFLLVGFVLGAVAGLVVGLLAPPASQYPTSQVVAFLAVILGAVGLVVAGAIAVALDAASRRRARVVEAQREQARPLEPDA